MKIRLTFKSIVSLILSIVMIIAVCPMALAAEKLPCGHNSYKVTIEAKEPTCEEYGYTAQKECNKCSFVLKAEYQPAIGHDYQMDKSTADANGVHFVCNNCSDTYIKKHSNWTYYLLPKDPTCTESGWTADRICNDCGYHEVSEGIAAGAHEFEVITSDASTHKVKCKKCSYVSPVESHTSVFVFDTGYNCYSESATGHEECSVCGFVTASDITTAAGQHRNLSVRVAQTGEYRISTCNDCNYSAITPIRCAACRSSLTSDEYTLTPATCTNTGYLFYNCNECSNHNNIPLDPMGHHLAKNYVYTLTPDCSREGVKSRKCYRCDYSDDITVPKTSHMFVVIESGIDATCTEDGLTFAGFCTMCGLHTNHVTIPKTGHNIVDYQGEKFCTNCYMYMIDGEEGTVECKCLCHNHDGLAQTLFKLLMFFCKLFRLNQSCDCGTVHYEIDVK